MTGVYLAFLIRKNAVPYLTTLRHQRSAGRCVSEGALLCYVKKNNINLEKITAFKKIQGSEPQLWGVR